MQFSTVAKYMRRSPYQALVAILIMSFTFYMISAFAVRTIISVKLIQYFETRPQLTVFFKDETNNQEIATLKKQVEDTGKTTSVTFVSKEQALKFYQEQNKNDPILLDLVTAEILPSSLEIQTQKPEYLSEMAAAVKDSPIVDQVVFQKEIIDTLLSWINAFKRVGMVEIAVLIFESILVIATIISFKILVKREEIETMKLLGATNWFVRMPFIFEGMIYGMTGAAIGWLLAISFVFYSTPYLESFLKGIPVFPLPVTMLLALLGVELVFAATLGVVASFIAVKRYLK